MRENIIIPLSICVAVLTGCSGKNQTDYDAVPNVIDVEEAFHNRKNITLTDLGEQVRYIPLETTDSSVVAVSSLTAMAVTDKFILIGASSVPITVFDKENGRYVGQVGQIGNGPEEYPHGTNFMADPITQTIYVRISPTKYQSYDAKGKFLKTVSWEESARGTIVAPYFMGDKFFTYVNLPSEHTTVFSYSYDGAGGEKSDSLPVKGDNKFPGGKPKLVLPLVGAEVLGGKTYLMQFENNKWTYGHQNNNAYWHLHGELRMKDTFNDTIFAMKDDFRHPVPEIVFHMGKWGGFERYEEAGVMTDKLIVTRVMETEHVVYFNLFQNMYDVDSWLKGRNSLAYAGVYNKATGVTKIQESAGIENSLEGLPRFSVYNVSTAGELVVCYQTETLIEAREKMLSEEQPEWLKQLQEDDNPVILLIK